MNLPPLEFVTRSKTGISLYTMEQGENKPTKKDFFPSSCCVEEIIWSKDGSLCLYREVNGIRLFDMKLNQERFHLELPKVVAVDISPLNNWIVTLVPFKNDPNLQIWDCKTGTLHFSLVQKSFSRSCWPYLQWDNQESRALFHCGECITLFNGHDLNDISSQQVIRSNEQSTEIPFPIKPNSMVSLSPSVSYPAFIVFSPKTENDGILAYFINSSVEEGNHFILKLQRPCLNCTQAECEWNYEGDRAVIKVSSDIDRTGVSYYGSSQLYFLFNDSKVRADILLNLMRGEHSVQASHFSMDGSSLCCLTTSVPASSMLFTAKQCHEEGSCGKYNVNTLLWSPHGRLIALAGFGNLSGEVHIWDCVEKKHLIEFKTEYITSCNWSNDSRYFIMGTCYPRMKIDNRLYVYKYNGMKLYEENVDMLYEIAIRPVVRGVYPLVPPTKEELLEIKKVVQKKAPGKYVPPHLRNKSGNVPGMNRSIPGLAPKPEKPKKTKPKTVKPVSPPPEVLQGPNLLEAIFASVEQPSETVDSLQKKLRNLNKKLREIEQIKTKWQVLNEEQTAKVSKEESLRKEIKEIEEKINTMK